MRALILCLALTALAACGQQSAPSNAAMDSRSGFAGGEAGPMGGVGVAREEAQAIDAAVSQDAPPASPPPPPPPPGQPAAEPAPAPAAQAPVAYLAYSYQVGLEVPGPRLTGLMDAHAQACVAAGPRLCQLIGSQRQGDPEAYISGNLQIRGEPAWLRGFMGRLESDADQAGGRVQARSTTTEDLTRAIVDTEASLRARRTLRDRLQALLASRPGRLSDLLEVERELARVQAEIDATQSNLAVMRTRVDMSALSISYESQPRSVAAGTFTPLRNALAGFVSVVVQGVAIIITLIAGLLPFALLLWLIGWLLLGWRKRRGGRFFNRPQTPPAPPAS
ncbi:MAG: DUF4349 domain-containing protein [Hyphomonadaceae bacterium]|nr:DUF4349 domain-containing protein [Hyphomonadaceae bacterium]